MRPTNRTPRAWTMATTALVAMAVLAGPRGAAAEPDWSARVSELGAVLAAAPDDTRALCELGFALVNLERWVEARTALDRAVTLLGTPTDAALARRLGACLFNRGLAAKGAGELDPARADFRRSVAVRPHPTVAKALAALSGTAPDEALVAAAQAACRAHAGDQVVACGPGDEPPRRVVVPPACAAGGEWALVALRAGLFPEVYAVNWRDDGSTRAAFLGERADWGMAGVPEWSGAASVERVAPGVCALVSDETESGIYACEAGEEDTHDYRPAHRTQRRVVVSRPDGLAVALDVPVDVDQCKDRWQLAVRLDGRGHARVSAESGTPPESDLGTVDLGPFGGAAP